MKDTDIDILFTFWAFGGMGVSWVFDASGNAAGSLFLVFAASFFIFIDDFSPSHGRILF